jgi:hypothetical protein
MAFLMITQLVGRAKGGEKSIELVPDLRSTILLLEISFACKFNLLLCHLYLYYFITSISFLPFLYQLHATSELVQEGNFLILQIKSGHLLLDCWKLKIEFDDRFLY